MLASSPGSMDCLTRNEPMKIVVGWMRKTS
jgi:hypothetical protein